MDVYLFDLEHLSAALRGSEFDCRSANDASSGSEHYDLAELNRMVCADIRRRAETN